MPSLAVEKNLLLKKIGKEITEKELNDVVFDFGVELDEIYEENGKTMVKFDIPANRYDLLSLEGFSTALRAYMSLDRFEDLNIKETVGVTVYRKSTHEREYIACGIIRGIKFDKDSYESFIGYQDKLHCSIGRNRSLLAIGTHDLDKIHGKITYQSIDLSDIQFTPLITDVKESQEIKNLKLISGAELKNHFSNDKKIFKFFDLLSESDKAVVFKCDDTVMSVPPIINSNTTKISLETKNIFVEVTGTDFNKVNTALKYILYNFRGDSVEYVDIVNEDTSEKIRTPQFHDFEYTISLETINKKLHLNLKAEEVKHLLERMLYEVTIDSDSLIVHVFDVRGDVLHECDIIEDIAIAYGFNNFNFRCPPIYTVGFEDPINKFSDKVRQELAIFGFIEALTLTLLSKAENIVDPELAVILGNPKSKEYEVVRTSLLPGILKSIGSNLHTKIPIKVFEVADVVLLNEKADEGAKNERRACCVIASNRSLLEDVQGPLSMLFTKCGINNFSYEKSCDSRYLENQNAIVKIGDFVIGTLGVLHPHVCKQFEIPYAASSFEINLEILFNYFMNK